MIMYKSSDCMLSNYLTHPLKLMDYSRKTDIFNLNTLTQEWRQFALTFDYLINCQSYDIDDLIETHYSLSDAIILNDISRNDLKALSQIRRE